MVLAVEQLVHMVVAAVVPEVIEQMYPVKLQVEILVQKQLFHYLLLLLQ